MPRSLLLQRATSGSVTVHGHRWMLCGSLWSQLQPEVTLMSVDCAAPGTVLMLVACTTTGGQEDVQVSATSKGHV